MSGWWLVKSQPPTTNHQPPLLDSLGSYAYTRAYAFQARLLSTAFFNRNFEIASDSARARPGVRTRLLEPLRQPDQVVFKDAAAGERHRARVRDEPARGFARWALRVRLHRAGHCGDDDPRRLARTMAEGRADACAVDLGRHGDLRRQRDSRGRACGRG